MSSSNIFEGIASIAQLVTAIAVVLGVWVAYRQLWTWRDERHETKLFDVSLELLLSAVEASDVLKSLRSPFDRIPIEEKDNERYPYQQRLKRFDETASYFERLRKSQLVAFAVLSDRTLNDAVDVIFDVRITCIVAIQSLDERNEVYGDEDEETKEHYRSLKREMRGTYSKKHDPLGTKQLEALETIREILGPKINFHK